MVIGEDLWEARMQMIEPSKVEMNKMVMNFLILEGYKEAAICFSQEANLPAEIDWVLIDQRIVIRKLILDGLIEEAIKQINELNPEILDKNSSLLFELKKQQLIELIKAKKTDEAIKFAQTRIAPKCCRSSSQ